MTMPSSLLSFPRVDTQVNKAIKQTEADDAERKLREEVAKGGVENAAGEKYSETQHEKVVDMDTNFTRLLCS
jgi:hypothetical protein